MNSKFLHFSAAIFLLGVNTGLAEGNRLILVDAYGDEVLLNNYETKKFIQITHSPNLRDASFQVSHFVGYNGRGPDTHDVCQKITFKDQEFFKHPNHKFCVIYFNHSSRTTYAMHDLHTNLTVEFGTKSILARFCKVHDSKLVVACSNIDVNTDHFEYSVCKIYGNGDRPLYIVTNKTTCKNLAIYFWNQGTPLFMGEYHLMSDLTELKIVCADKKQKVDICQKRYKEKTCLDAQTAYKCDQNIQIDQASYDRLFVTKLSANLNKQSSTHIFVVNLVKPQVHFVESGNCEVTCRITNIKSSTGHFRFKFTIYDEVSAISSDYVRFKTCSLHTNLVLFGPEAVLKIYFESFRITVINYGLFFSKCL
uniref:Uncharacterized protein n=1 Tax=Romanomermis culicivorax TaxID=13658 RepID=A0A915KCL8_ROMCU